MAKSKSSKKSSKAASKKVMKKGSKKVSKSASKKAAKKGSKKAAKKGSKKKGSKKAKKGSKKVAKKGSKKAKKGSKKSRKGLRSFKVKLPGNETYAGRFTGLTPYQAANKALSKYFRENKAVKSKISFTIKESTRSSKRNEYTYTGKRVKLETPIEYSIGEGKLITKRYKNKLTKVKKGSKPTV